MNWFKFFRMVGSSKRPFSKTSSPRHRLALETLESREVPATPTVTSVVPTTGALTPLDPTTGTITVSFSENVRDVSLATASTEAQNSAALVANNDFRLFASDGTLATITSVTYTDAAGLNPAMVVISASNLSVAGTALTAGTYSLFLRGDRIKSVSTSDTLAAPGQIVVANGGRGNVSTVALNGSSLGAVQTLGLPSQGTAPAAVVTYAPTAAVIADVNADGFSDLLVASSGFDNVQVYLGNALGGFSSLADTTLALPTGAGASALIATDLTGDGKVDIAVANRLTNNVSVFLNQNTAPGQLLFSAATTTAAGNAPVAIVAANINGDLFPDLVVANGALDAAGTSYTVNVLTNPGTGVFNAAVPIIVGTSAPLDLTTPTSLAVGFFDNDALVDLVVGGATGLSILTNTSAGAVPSFTPLFIPVATPIVSVATGIVRTNAGGSTLNDIVATTTNAAGGLMAFLNDTAAALGSPAAFRATGPISATGAGPTAPNVATTGTPNALQLTDLTNDGRPELVYTLPTTNGVVSRARLQTGRITNIPAAVGAPIVITSNGHGLQTGQQVVIAGVGGTLAANGTFFVGTTTGNTFAIVDAAGTAILADDFYTAGTGAWIATPGIVTNVTKTAAGSPLVVTSFNHGLVSGQRITIANVAGAGATAANGTFFITRLTADTFSLNGTENSTFPVTYTARTGTYVLPVISTGVGPVALALSPILSGAITTTTGTGTPITVTSNNHGLANGERVRINGVSGNTAANGTFLITNVTQNTFDLLTLASAPVVGNGTYTAGGTWSASLDFTGDDIVDLVAVNKTDNSLSFYTGSGSGTTGDGSFLVPTNLALAGASANPRDPIAADLNRDGLLDLIVTDSKNNAVNVFLGLRGGGYAPAVSLGTTNSSRSPVSVAVGDVDKDGKLDILVASSQDNNVAIFKNQIAAIGGAVAFSTPTTVSAGRTPTQVMLADVNNDGALDLLVAHNGGGGFGGTNRGVTVRLGNGDATFQNRAEFASGQRAVAIGIADFNRDGNLDFAVANDNAPGTVRIMSGAANGTFTSSGDFTVGSNPTDLVIADFNNDGFADVATASRNNTTTENVSVLLNNLGTGFATAINTSVPTGIPLQSITALNVNSDAFIDVVVTSRAYDAPSKGSPPPPPNPLNNTHVLLGSGDGSFTVSDDYSVDIPTTTPAMGSATPVPSFVGVVSDPFRLLTTFNIGGTRVSANLVVNGSFENRDLTNEQGNLDGWINYRPGDTVRTGAGAFVVQTGGTSPLSDTTVPVPSGKFQAMLDQQNLQPFSGNTNPNATTTYSGSHALYQDIFIPTSAPGTTTSALLSFTLYLNSASAWSDANTTPQLDYRTSSGGAVLANQQVRVDIMSTSGDILGTTSVSAGGNVLQNVYQTLSADPTTATIVKNNINLSAFAGQTIRLRIATTNNQGKLIVGVDNVRLRAVFTDVTNPQLLAISLRNPSFLANAASLEQSTDPTITGRVVDNGSINNIRQITFDLGNNGFGGLDDVNITTVDANGYFTYTASTLLSGVNTVPIKVIDQAGNSGTLNYKFVLQGPSLTNWSAVGPGPIDISSQNLNYKTVSGKITGIAVDPTDASGNTFFVGSANGGVWKTVDGGSAYIAVTDNVVDATGQRVNVPVGGLSLSNGNNTAGVLVKAVYAATGVDDFAFTSRTSVGVLRSLSTINNGRTWQVTGGGVFAGARVSKIVADPSNPDIVYVAVTSWDNAAKEPAIFKTTNGTALDPTSVVWTNVLLPQNMFTGPGATLGAGTPLASVTDLLVDPFSPNVITIGLGNIGQRTAQANAGLWRSSDFGVTWQRQVGGDASVAGGALFGNTGATAARTAELQGFLPSGLGVGRITIGQGTGNVTDEGVTYVLMANAPGLNPTQFNQGDFQGLYKSKDGLLNFTRVMLRQPDLLHGRFTESYSDIGLLGDEGATVGSLIVDPNNANVVYVGGSRRFLFRLNAAQHALIRVDTGNMRDSNYLDPITLSTPNDGDDISKVNEAQSQGGLYPTNSSGIGPAGGVAYQGEGVYWYDIEQGKGSDGGMARNLPTAIHRIAIDPQGRLLFGTEKGLYRGTALGFSYDFSSSFAGILAGGGGFGGGTPAFNPAGMTITELNGNLQITDLTSVAIDPTTRGTYYISASGVGTATTTGGTAWQTSGLTGPTVAGAGNLGIPNSYQVVAGNLAPGATVDTATTLYRTWQFKGAASLVPEASLDGGGSFSTVNSVGVSISDTAGVAPVLAINPVKVNVGGVFFDELLFGTNKVYSGRTNGVLFIAITGSDLGATAERYSALAFSFQNNVYLGGTDAGRVFKTNATGSFVDITSNLTAAGAFKVNGITVDSRDTTGNTIYVTLASPNGSNGVYRTTDGGASWVALPGSGTGLLPKVVAYKLVIDTRPSTGAAKGRFYLGTDRGVFTSGDSGATWQSLGNGLPAAPVVDLQFNPNLEVLAAATQGRGVFTLSTARSGPAVVTQTPTTPVTDGALTDVFVTFNTPVDPRSFTADSNNTARAVMSLLSLTTTEYVDTRIGELVQKYLGRPAGAPEIAFGRGRYFFNDSNGNPLPTTIAPLAGATINATQVDGEFVFLSFLLADQGYYNTAVSTYGAGTASNLSANGAFVERVYRDLFGRTSIGDAQTTNVVGFLNSNPGPAARLAVVRQFIGLDSADADPRFYTPNALVKEFYTNVVAGLFNRYLARNYPAVGAVSNEITAQVALLLAGPPKLTGGLLPTTTLGTQLLYITAGILSSTEAYRKMGNDYALPAGVRATAITTAAFSGAVDSFNRPLLDLVVAGSDDKVRIFKGRAGGGYALTPSLILDLPAAAAAGDLVVADFNGDGLADLAVANTGLTETAANNTVSVFLNTRTAVGQLAFANAVNYNAGGKPVGIAAGDVDGDGRLDLVVANQALYDPNVAVLNDEFYTASVLLGNGTGGFTGLTAGSATRRYQVGNVLTPVANSTLLAPTDIALAYLTGAAVGAAPARPVFDLIVSGTNGVKVLPNTTTTAGTPTFNLTNNRLTGATPLAVTSVVAGDLDGDGDPDIVITSDNAAGEAIVYQNAGILVAGAPTFTAPAVPAAFNASTTAATGSNPRSARLGDMNGDGKLDLVVANNSLVDGGVSVLLNQTVAGGTTPVVFGTRVAYPVTGTRPAFVALGDTNQDGLLDVALGYEGSEFVSLIVGEQQGILRVSTDRNWMDALSRNLTGRPLKASEQNALAPILATDAPAFLLGPTGSVSPLSVTPTDSTNLTYKLTFAPQLIDGTYQFYISPNILGISPKDFIDQNGTFVNTGNAFNQNRNAVNGEVPTPTAANDRYNATLTVNHSDSGRFITAAYSDLLGRSPDNPNFAALEDTILEPARLAALNSTAKSLFGATVATTVASTEEVDHLVTLLYQKYLRRAPVANPNAELIPTRNFVVNGGASFRDIAVGLLGSPEYFAFAGGTNTGFVNQLYLDTLGVANVGTGGGASLVTRLGLPASNPASLTPFSLARLVIFNDLVLQRTVAEYFTTYLGRTPVRNAADPSLDETTAYVALLKLPAKAPVGGIRQLTGDEQVILALVSSPEYLRVHGNSDFEWLKSVYTLVLGRSGIQTTSAITAASWAAPGGVGQVTITAKNALSSGQAVTIAGITGNLVPAGYNGTFTVLTATATSFTYALATNPGTATLSNATAAGKEFNDTLDSLLVQSQYLNARESVLSLLINSREYRNRVYTANYAQLFVPANTRVPTQAELDAAEAIYQLPGLLYGLATPPGAPLQPGLATQRLERVVANITSLPEYFALESLNSGWLSRVYGDLIPGVIVSNGLTATRQAFLDGETPGAGNTKTTADLALARSQVAADILNSNEYRGILVNNLYVSLLGRPATAAELAFWLPRMSNPAIADTQQTISRLLMRLPEYYRFRAL